MANKKKTDEEIDEELLLNNRPYKRVDSYRGANIPIKFQCTVCGDVKSRRPSAVLSQTNKCKSCFDKSRAKTNAQFDLELRKKGIKVTRVGEYSNNYTKILFRCEAGHTWPSQPAHILNGISCPICLTKKKTSNSEEYDNKLFINKIPITRLEEYINSQTPILHRCSIGHEWKARPSNILRGRGCPMCVDKFGFKMAKPAILYYVEISSKLGDIKAYKIGITNTSLETRFQRDKRDKNIILLWSKSFDTGDKAYALEQEILSKAPSDKANLPGFLRSGGNSELFTDNIIDWLEEKYEMV